ncbi:vitellogenin-like [Saccoglossus kowalevskii]
MAILTFNVKDTTFKIFWTGRKHVFNIEFTGDYYRGKMCGLLGNGDGDATNDFQKPNGVIVKNVTEFGESWKVQGKQC